MASRSGTGIVSAIGGALFGAATPTAAAERPAGLAGSFPIVELRQYTLHDGRRDTLIDLFEREFIETQEAVGMKVIGTFIDLDRPNRFVWLRGFRDMDSRAAGLTAFYGGPEWQAHRDEANATMIDSDNVLLLHAPAAAAEFLVGGERPALGESSPAGLIVATIYYLKGAPTEAVPLFDRRVKPGLERAGIPLLAWFVPETESNNFPRLPVREGERALLWFARFQSEQDYAAQRTAIMEAQRSLMPLLERQPEVLRLKPTKRSQLR